MQKFALIFLLGLLSSPVAAVVNGKNVSDEEFSAEYPWMVAVVHNDLSGNCGGVLIAPDWVLTAAHCTALKKHVLVGSAEHRKAERVEIINAYRHPEFSARTLQNDIGVLQLAEPVDLPLAPLATDVEARVLLLPDQPGIILGWGRGEKRRGMALRLQRGEVALEGLGFAGSQIGVTYEGGGPCTRDSGGPLVLTSLSGELRVTGVISATDGELCSKDGGLAIYTNISVVRPFIERFVSFADAP